MRKINTNQMEEISWNSPKGKFQGFGKEVSQTIILTATNGLCARRSAE